jgi:hypothetical protein
MNAANDVVARGAQGEDKAKKRSNPHKFLLYRPTFSQFLVFLSTAFKAPHPHPPPLGAYHINSYNEFE